MTDIIEEQKRAKLLDMIRRVIANPQNAKRVADAIALDWHPTICVGSDGNFTILVGGAPQ